MKPALVILAFLVMLCLGVFASTSKRYMKMLAFSLAIPMVKWPTLALMLFSAEFYRGTVRGMEVALSYLLAFALLVALAFRGKAGKFFADKGSLFFFLYWLLSLPSLMNCENFLYAWFEIWKVPMIFLVYRAVRGYCLYTRDYVTPLYGFTVVSIINFLVVVYQHFFVHVSQAHGLFAHQNSMSMWNVLAAAIFFAAFLNKKTSLSLRVFAVCFVCSSLACVRTYSRGSMIALPIALVIVALISFFRNFHFRLPVRLGLVGVVMMLGLALAIPKIMNRFSGGASNSARMRVVFAEAAERMIEDHPFAGVGLNNWGIKINPPYTYSQHREEFRMPENYKDGIVETIYLLTWAECGTPCLLALLAFLFWHLYKAFRLTHFNKDKDEFWIAAGCAGGLTAIYLQSTLEWVLKQSINFTELAICFGIIAAINAAHREEEKKLREQKKLARREKLKALSQARKDAKTEATGETQGGAAPDIPPEATPTGAPS